MYNRRRSEKHDAKTDKNPYRRREEKVTSRAFDSVKQSVEPVARDTNKTRRKNTRERLVGETVPTERPVANLKKVLHAIKRRRP